MGKCGVVSLKRIIGMLFILAVCSYIAIYMTFLSIPASEVFSEVMPDTPVSRYDILEDSLFDFVVSNLAGKDGEVRTNLQNYPGSRDTLSESVGLLMNYCVLSNKHEQFVKEFSFLRSHLMTDGRFVKWRVGESKTYCNASIDDLRIIRALLDGYDRWGNKEFYNMAGILQESIFSNQVKDRSLYEFYDWKNGKSKHRTPLCYLDLYTVDRISEFNPAWLAVEEKALSVVSNGRISNGSPFFYKYYDYDTESYDFDEEYTKQKGICLTYTLYTVLHLAEVNEDTSYFTEWLRKEIDKGRLYGWYDPLTMKPANTVESTAVYALAAVYAKKTGERELCWKLVDGMMKFMVADRKSAYYGGFGHAETKYFYSFDNLTALWALTVSDK